MDQRRNTWSGHRLGTFAAVKWKTIRAQQLADRIGDLVSTFGSQAFLDTSSKRVGDWVEISVLSVKPLPAEVSLSLSEACHHLRSSLDHIAWAVSSRPQDRWARLKVKFPIFADQDEFDRRVSSALLGADQRVVGIVRRYQPFNSSLNPKNTLLEKLQELNNWDKHQELLAGVVATAGSSVSYIYRGATIHSESLGDTVLTEPNVKLGVLPWEDTWSEKGISLVPHIRLRAVFHSDMPETIRGADIVGFLSQTSAFINDEMLPEFGSFLQ
ncbi:hypothetical protein G5V65_21060 [Rhodobacter sp. HX-7-19]|uniref:Uncharacterized protein n=1 Tax=Paragemmobacter kunshanensis TaxID=2583234 RepID=A0A6M1TYQ1_9RHOB|nr:hypothetical protein [Rhodobacter kunshanensis]NGQ93380.1 hypothetical protein [Rhodobacter kunshanensis]